jgi:hypothetical protein
MGDGLRDAALPVHLYGFCRLALGRYWQLPSAAGTTQLKSGSVIAG